eukprot:CAMPEP_0170541130 /NCGR_PEP_ID=MMETSP0211-20121228/950_1 /TAXON_ID=311385 /ORGANISM="Pseudokeronopsis sp., Strain OXSARD2" /LENGTH=106 /DNA_ID=CAMNT_0010843751 /DNA_START=45 /DNA_END=362 /DNA_ORIENTATION=+
MMDFIPYFFSSFLIILALIIEYYTSNFTAMILMIYGIYPVLEQFTHNDMTNFSARATKEFENDARFCLPLYASIIMDFYCHFMALYRISNDPTVNESIGIMIFFVW